MTAHWSVLIKWIHLACVLPTSPAVSRVVTTASVSVNPASTRRRVRKARGLFLSEAQCRVIARGYGMPARRILDTLVEDARHETRLRSRA